MTVESREGREGRESPETRDATIARVYASMQFLALDSDDRRREVMETTGLPFVRTKALRRLLNGPLGMSELASRLLTDRPYLTLVVDDLERRGLVVRTVSPEDRRAKLVTITDAGRAVAEQAQAILSRPPEALAKLDDAEIAELGRLFTKLVT